MFTVSKLKHFKCCTSNKWPRLALYSKDVYNAHCQNRKLHKTDISKLWLFPPEKIQLNKDIVENQKTMIFCGKFLQTQKLINVG